MGFGDIAVNKKMKLFVRAFYGRLAQYSKSIELIFDKEDKTLLHETILNNIYRGNTTSEDKVKWFADYMYKNIVRFQSISEDENLRNNFEFTNIN